MSPDEPTSPSDQDAIFGYGNATDGSPQSLGDQATIGAGQRWDVSDSLGDQSTFGGAASVSDDPLDDRMEVVNLATRYRIEGQIGKGGMGEVLLATDLRLGRKVAIKRILGDAPNRRTAVSRFLIEAKSIAALNHQNIVQIYDFGRATDGPFLIMEYVEGCSLLERCRQRTLDLEQAIQLTCQLCDGLGKAHAAGIIHRDIKPANVLLTADGVPKLTDFGLAKDESVDDGLSVSGTVLGTLDFMPPEQRKDVKLTDARSDLWSLAATLYQMVTGEPPRVIDLDSVPTQLRSVLAQALKTRKEDRYQTAKDFQDALRGALAGKVQVELEEGICPICATKNPTDRRFCRECATSLEVPCLACNRTIPMWEKVCNNCGGKQHILLEQRRMQMNVQQSNAESLLKEYDFAGAAKLAIALRDEPDLRLQHLKSWSDDFLQQIERGRQQQLEWIRTILREALEHDKACDYASGIQTLEQAPAILRGTKIAHEASTAGELLSQLRQKHNHSKKLRRIIEQRVASQQLNGLQTTVDELLKLHPERAELQRLKQQLVKREAKLATTRDQLVSNARTLMEKQDYEAAIKELQKVDPDVATDEFHQLQAEAIGKRDRVAELYGLINSAVSEKKLHGLLMPVQEYLGLKSDDPKMVALNNRLVERNKKNAAQHAKMLKQAEMHFASCQFEAAVNALEKIPLELQTEEAFFLEGCRELAALREQTMDALRKGLESESYDTALKAAETYTSSLQLHSFMPESAVLKDVEFQQLVKLCNEAWKKQNQAADSAVRWITPLLSIIGILGWILVYGDIIRLTNSTDSTPPGLAETLGLKFASIPAGEFRMGSDETVANLIKAGFVIPEGFDLSDESPARTVRMSAFRLQTTEVTRGQFAEFVRSTNYRTDAEKDGKGGWGFNADNGTFSQDPQYNWRNPGFPQTDNHPVVNVSWNDAVAFAGWLTDESRKRGESVSYQLPTEAQFEYALRAGSTTRYATGDSPQSLEGHANVQDASHEQRLPNLDYAKSPSFKFDDGVAFTAAVGSYPKNAFGLYDMHGNVWEWCRDWYDARYYSTAPDQDPPGPQSGSSRVLRGGSWNDVPLSVRCANRDHLTPDHRFYNGGFRLLLE